MDRKAYSAFKMYYKRPAKYPLLDSLYGEAFKLNGVEISTFNLTPYMTLARYYYKSDPQAMPAEKVLDIHLKISDAIEGKRSAGSESEERLKKEQDKVDALLSSMENILSCDFIAQQLVPKMEKDPSDLNTAKKVFTYSLKAKCSDQPYFTTAGELIFENDPTFQLSYALASKYLAANEFDKAIRYFKKGLELAEIDEDRFNIFISLASAYSKSNNKASAREMAKEAIAVKPGDTKAFNLLGNLYFGSYEECKAGESKVKDRAVFIAAFNMYAKAGNSEQMAACKAQFPSIEEIFNEDMKEGDEVFVGCWINETVVLQRRD